MSRLEKLLAALAVLPFGLGLSASGPAPVEGEVVFAFADPDIVESSGLIAHDGLFATVNDSGDGGRVFTVDPADGATVAETTWDGAPADVESMALTPEGDVLVGDTGGNISPRDSVEVYRVPFGQDGAVDPTTYELTYPDGTHDSEALLIHPGTGQVLVVAKEFIGRLYAAPLDLDPDRPNRLKELDDEVLPITTDGAFFPDGNHLVLRGYVKAAVYTWPSLDQVGEEFYLPDQEQGEGIAVGDDGSVYLSSEGTNSEVLRIRLPAEVRDAMAGPEPEEKPDRDRPDRDDPADEGGPVSDETLDGDPGHDSSDVARPLWPWAVGGIVGVVVLVVLIRSLRPR
ncbi:hypothetical protein DJ010_16020 [Nocardioides silvaticus]|uniref:WD40 repeat domain-containing protein n=1 Tax=Nocardioides silvaticus TaxID=2201891 RepID=A0A316TFW7_9ACTN|nr:hypothetical protein [Nocardioides silvaticus]PWN02035.1 hypothetical protein DJ010_16020 [Nocardioides silvaticus]